MSILEQLLTGGLFLAVLGCYVYVTRAVADVKADQAKLKDCVEGTIKENTAKVQKLEVTVARLEERVGNLVDALKKGVDGSH